MTIYLTHYVHLNEKQKICIPEVPDFDGYHYQESIIAKEFRWIGYLSKRESDRFMQTHE
jgi:hypothetical protein